MRRLFAVALLLLATSAAAQRRHATLPPAFVADAAPRPDILSAADLTQVRTTHVSLDLTVDFDQYQVRGSVTESIVNLTGTRTFTVDTRFLDIKSVTIDGAPTTWSLATPLPKFGRIGNPMTIDIEPTTRVVRIEYASHPNAKSNALNWLAPLATDGDVAPFLYTYSEADRAREWIPIQDTPGVRVTYDATIRVPPGLLAVMSAKNPTEASSDGVYHFTMEKPIPPYLIALAVGRMQFHPLSERTGFYAEPENVAAGMEDLQYLPAMLAAAERLLGPYPFDRYDIVLMPPAFHAGGMENPQANFINILSAAPGNHEPVPSSTVAHELSHSWAGDLVTCGTWEDTWLNEGFASYYQGRILDEMGQPERGELEFYFAVQSYSSFAQIDPPLDELTRLHQSIKKGGGAPFDTTTYDKGALFLKMIEDTAGRAAFDAFMREWMSRYRFHWADDVAFVNLLHEKIAVFDSLRADEWLYDKGTPVNLTVPATAAIQVRMSAAASSFKSGATLTSLGASAWRSYERDLFMIYASDAIPSRMAEVDAMFHITSLNTESIAWEQAMAATLYEPGLPAFERFLMRGGGNVVSAYQALKKTPAGYDYALKIYEKARSEYDWGTQQQVDTLLYGPVG